MTTGERGRDGNIERVGVVGCGLMGSGLCLIHI
jgi:predicted homoserine dehydrogenase-like protein